MAATADLMQQKLRQRYIASPETNVGALLQRYRDDQNIENYEGYVDHVAPSALIVDGSSGATNGVSTPDHASFAVTDLDVRMLLSMETWLPLFLTAHLIDQGDAAGNLAWTLSIHPNKRLRTAIYGDGTNITQGPEADADIPFVINSTEPHWIRSTSVTGTKISTYYTAPYDGTLTPSWTQLGSAIDEAGSTSVFNSTSPVRIPGPLALTWRGRAYYAEIRSGVDGAIVANPDFRNLAPGTTSFVDSTGKTWTVNGNAKIATSPAALRDDENRFWNAFVP